MWKSIAGWASNQVRSERANWDQRGAARMSELLPAARVEQVLREEGVSWRECVYSSAVTLWTFLSQVLSPDHSCRDAVARLQAFLIDDGQTPCAPQTGPYCKARQRLPEQVCARLARDGGVELHERVADCDLLGGRPIKLVDGTSVSMPDTAENQAAYPQSASQKPGVGFPIARVVVLLSLACGAALDMAICDSLLSAIASHRVGNRPNRYEPRAIKRRPKPHALLTVPRQEAKKRLAA